MPDNNNEDLFEALERAVAEVEALRAIYDTAFTVHSTHELRRAQAALEKNHQHNDGTACCFWDDDERHPDDAHAAANAIRLDVSLDLSYNVDGEKEEDDTAAAAARTRRVRLCCGLPPGYPDSKALVVSIQQPPVSGGTTSSMMSRQQCEKLTAQLQQRAEALVGQEAILELVQELQDLLLSTKTSTSSITNGTAENLATTSDSISIGNNAEPLAADQQNNPSCPAGTAGIGRRWIWVHHINDAARRKSIVKEARELSLGGFLKYGYPGIVVVEGSPQACNDFVSWIKGSKSRPGGFGRNWGHHVKGEIDDDLVESSSSTTGRRLPAEFVELEEMRDLGAASRECGVEEEFLEYVMQHK